MVVQRCSYSVSSWRCAYHNLYVGAPGNGGNEAREQMVRQCGETLCNLLPEANEARASPRLFMPLGVWIEW
jgi:hypothetical protein